MTRAGSRWVPRCHRRAVAPPAPPRLATRSGGSPRAPRVESPGGRATSRLDPADLVCPLAARVVVPEAAAGHAHEADANFHGTDGESGGEGERGETSPTVA